MELAKGRGIAFARPQGSNLNPMNQENRAMRTLRFPVTAVLILAFSAQLALATKPFGNTLLAKKDGRWHWPKSPEYTRNLVIVDEGRQVCVLTPDDLFPGEERSLYVSETTAGPVWGMDSLSYIITLDKSDYLTMHFWTGKRLLIRLDKGTLEAPGAHATALRDADRREIRSILNTSADALSRGGPPDAGTSGALILAGRYGMADLRGQIRKIERYSYSGPFAIEMDPPYANGFAEHMREDGPATVDDRPLAHLALRRLGFSPQGYPQIYFEQHKKDDSIAPGDRWLKAAELDARLASEQVYRLIGPPDYIESVAREGGGSWNGAWRYDFDGKSDCSLLVAWSEDGTVARVLKVTPALWHGDVLFSERARRPVFQADGSLPGVSLYSKEFLGKIEDFVKTKRR